MAMTSIKLLILIMKDRKLLNIYKDRLDFRATHHILLRSENNGQVVLTDVMVSSQSKGIPCMKHTRQLQQFNFLFRFFLSDITSGMCPLFEYLWNTNQWKEIYIQLYVYATQRSFKLLGPSIAYLRYIMLQVCICNKAVLPNFNLDTWANLPLI